MRVMDELGPGRKVAAPCGMFYCWAWGYWREFEAAAGDPFFERRLFSPAGIIFLLLLMSLKA